MATRILEHGRAAFATPVIIPPINVAQAAMTASAGSARSAALASETRLVTVQSDEAVNVKIGDAATVVATSSDYKIPAGGEATFEAWGGQKVAIIAAA
jgi:hypothetical protein